MPAFRLLLLFLPAFSSLSAPTFPPASLAFCSLLFSAFVNSSNCRSAVAQQCSSAAEQQCFMRRLPRLQIALDSQQRPFMHSHSSPSPSFLFSMARRPSLPSLHCILLTTPSSPPLLPFLDPPVSLLSFRFFSSVCFTYDLFSPPCPLSTCFPMAFPIFSSFSGHFSALYSSTSPSFPHFIRSFTPTLALTLNLTFRRLGSPVKWEKATPKVPKYAPFIAAGFFFGSATLLYDVPFDPFLPWIFMGGACWCGVLVFRLCSV
jgi:hypothetical protein